MTTTTAGIVAVGSTSAIEIAVASNAKVILAGITMVAYKTSHNQFHRAHAGDFDAPPPLTESDVASGLERSEMAGSLERLDDDSTYAPTTSRASGPEDPVSFVRDVFGRETFDVSEGNRSQSVAENVNEFDKNSRRSALGNDDVASRRSRIGRGKNDEEPRRRAAMKEL